MSSAPAPHGPWRDPLVWLGALLGAAVTGHALFAGPYLPYIDWSNHLALISVLAHGGESGALEFMTRSWAPTPYLLYYALAAGLAQGMSVVTAAKAALVLSAGLLALGGAELAWACGRSPRLGAIAPLSMFGVAMGFGFASFVFATPLLLFVLASNERLLNAGPDDRRRRAAALAIWLCLAYLGHALIFLMGCALCGIRGLQSGLLRWRSEGPRAGVEAPLRVMIAAIPAVLLALPETLAHLNNPWNEAGTAAAKGAGPLAHFEPWAQHHRMLYGHLLERGSTEHVTVMGWAAALLVALFVKALITRFRAPLPAPPGGRGLELYAAAMLALFLFGPMSLEWPSSIWMVYPRFGTIALVFPFLLPRCDLRGVAGVAATAACVTLVAWNASINAGHVERFNGWARQYDQVRETIPPRSRVLALTLPDSGDMTNLHPALGSLYFYHMVDGASYVAFLFDAAALPVRQRQDVKPRAPFWRNVRGFNPKIHGVDFDYLVLRGTTLTTRTSQAGLHKRVASINGWDVFQTLQPSPRPQSQ